MRNTYTRKEAMELLALTSTNAFLWLERRYPEAFVVVKGVTYGSVEYDKAMFDRFVRWRKRFKREKR